MLEESPIPEIERQLKSLQPVCIEEGGSVVLMDRELAMGGTGCKYVFQDIDANGKKATFETGSFFDNGGLEGEVEKHDICVSTMGGCTRGCRFCAVSLEETLGYERILTAEEIVYQVVYAVRDRNPNDFLPNVLGLMGNGEPADNFQNVITAIQTLATMPDLSLNRVTISTIGESKKGLIAFTKAFQNFAFPVKLQFSLHVVDERKRREIIPGRRKIMNIMKDVDRYARLTGYPVKFNVVLMESDNFSNAGIDDAKAVAQLLQQPSFYDGETQERRLKLSAFNSIPGISFRTPSKEILEIYVRTLREMGIGEIKKFRGSGINIEGRRGGFACGQLRATTFIQ
jgi:23S rRNA (adenine2503-C2)-methyltransferase